MGEADLAQRADQERKLLASKPGGPLSAQSAVRWVDSKSFAATSGQDVPWPAEVAKKTR